ncbi:hypothetical protein DFS33DRAFT_1379864 [Desarmillaria ectypa]|nr:hypothetical protein DFS33DRAFT_1379864 [Desarmillaria ectypa]
MFSQNITIPELQPATVANFLRYLIPPVQLPPHLISTPLLQRHHFLQINPQENLADYLTWPSPDQPRILDLLSSLPDDALASDLSICYTGDQESTYAHAHILSSLVRLIFQWDYNDASWKYHNAGLMPFPQSSSQRLGEIASHDKEEAAYWDAYGQEDHHDEGDHHALVHDSHAHTEDAYWAQYANVHGSGDSTIPSPVPEKRRPATNHEPTVVHIPSHAQDLSDRLLALTSRLESFPAISDVVEDIPHTQAFELTLSDSDSSPSEEPVKAETWLHADNETPLRDSIRGLYMLWRSSKRHWKEPATDEQFLSIVRDAIQEI